MKLKLLSLFSCCVKDTNAVDPKQTSDIQEDIIPSQKEVELYQINPLHSDGDDRSSPVSVTEELRTHTPLDYVMEANIVALEALICKNTSLLRTQYTAIDPTGRCFEDIYPLEYAFWARDIRMINMILEYLEPQEAYTQIRDTKYTETYSIDAFSKQLNKVCTEWHKISKQPKEYAAALQRLNRLQRKFPVHIIKEFGRPMGKSEFNQTKIVAKDFRILLPLPKDEIKCTYHLEKNGYIKSYTYDQQMTSDIFYRTLEHNPNDIWVRGDADKNRLNRAAVFGFNRYHHFFDLSEKRRFNLKVFRFMIEQEAAIKTILSTLENSALTMTPN